MAAALLVTGGCASSGSAAFVPKSSPSAAQSTGAGLGATEQEWRETHHPDTTALAGQFYDPDPSLKFPNIPEKKTPDRFDGVNVNGGRITDYTERFAPHTPIAAARAAARAGLPKDSTTVWFATKNGCTVEVAHSAQIAKWFGSAIKDTSGLVLISYSSEPTAKHFDTANVQRASLEPGDGYATESSYNDQC